MGEFIAGSKVKSAEMQIKVIRANGTVEDLGTVAKYNNSITNQTIQSLTNWIKSSKIYTHLFGEKTIT